VLGTARFMGQAAAQRAIRAGRPLITAEDYQSARERVHQMSDEALELFGPCPWLP
jgi:histone H3/H4